MTQGSIITIVEGESEVEAVPILLRRLIAQRQWYNLQPVKPLRAHRYKVVKPGELEKAIELATHDKDKRPNPACVMVILDADKDDPKVLREQLLKRCRKVTTLPCAVVIPKHELECWFLGAKESLRGYCGIKMDAKSPDAPESIRGAKERLTQNMTGSRAYNETADQPAFAQQFDLEMAKARCASFAKMIEEFERIAREAIENMNVHERPGDAGMDAGGD